MISKVGEKCGLSRRSGDVLVPDPWDRRVCSRGTRASPLRRRGWRRQWCGGRPFTLHAFWRRECHRTIVGPFPPHPIPLPRGEGRGEGERRACPPSMHDCTEMCVTMRSLRAVWRRFSFDQPVHLLNICGSLARTLVVHFLGSPERCAAAPAQRGDLRIRRHQRYTSGSFTLIAALPRCVRSRVDRRFPKARRRLPVILVDTERPRVRSRASPV